MGGDYGYIAKGWNFIGNGTATGCNDRVFCVISVAQEIMQEWRDSGKIVIEGDVFKVSYVALGPIISGCQFCDAIVQLVQPDRQWYIIFTASDLQISGEYVSKHQKILENSNVLLVDLGSPSRTKVYCRNQDFRSGYEIFPATHDTPVD